MIQFLTVCMACAGTTNNALSENVAFNKTMLYFFSILSEMSHSDIKTNVTILCTVAVTIANRFVSWDFLVLKNSILGM